MTEQARPVVEGRNRSGLAGLLARWRRARRRAELGALRPIRVADGESLSTACGRKKAAAQTSTRIARLKRTALGVAMSAGLLGAPMMASTAWASSPYMPGGRYIVTDTQSTDSSAAASQVASVGAGVLKRLDGADSVLSQLDSSQASALAAEGVTLTPDVTVSMQGGFSTVSGAAPAAVFPQQSGATQLWANGDTGSGVNVAVLDTGIDPLPDFAGRLVGGVDLSGEGNAFQDSYGHGTFVAGLIAGNGTSSGGQYVGEAPGAGLVSVKVAGASGNTDLATVIDGVEWVIANQKRLDISVLNMSLGYVPVASTSSDPLDLAVEKAWNSGVTVVASAGNDGPFNGTILSPGDDPLVITAGAVNDLGQTNPLLDTMTAFSSVGPTTPDGWFKPDLVASGASVVSLAAPGSTVLSQNPGALIGASNFVGSGTSFSAAITSGAAALVLANGSSGVGPDGVKARLLGSTLPGPVGNPFVDGHGILNAYGAVNDYSRGNPVKLSQQGSSTGLSTSTGGSVSLATTWALSAWNQSNWSGSAWNGSAWNGSAWNGSAWNGSAWNGSAWNGSAWNGSAWNGSAWNGSAWNGSAWNGSAWNGSAWKGSAWNGSAWNGSAWNGSAWNGSAWNGSAWNGSAWNGTAWNGTAWNGSAWNGAAWNGSTWN